MATIQRNAPFGRLRPRRVVPLPLQRLDPVIRIAHRITGPLHVDWRIIFDYELVLVCRGTGQWQIETQTMPFAPGYLLLIPPFQPHRLDSLDDSRCEHIAIHFDFGRGLYAGGPQVNRRKPYEIMLAAGLLLPRETHLSAVNPLRQLFNRLVQMHAGTAPLQRLEARILLMEILLKLLAQPALPTENNPPAPRFFRGAHYAYANRRDSGFQSPVHARDFRVNAAPCGSIVVS